MAGPWREWKTQSRFPTLSTGPWKSRQHREIPTFPRPGFAPDGKVGNQKPETGFPLSPAGLATTITFSIQPTKIQKGAWPGTPVHTFRFHAHSALEPNRTFMLILRLENATGAGLGQEGGCAPLTAHADEADTQQNQPQSHEFLFGQR